jgi:hypothetical protein
MGTRELTAGARGVAFRARRVVDLPAGAEAVAWEVRGRDA